jgi:hypothetical protein
MRWVIFAKPFGKPRFPLMPPGGSERSFTDRARLTLFLYFKSPKNGTKGFLIGLADEQLNYGE